MLKTLAGFLLTAILGSQAFAQAPAPIPPIPDLPRTVTYNISSSTPQVSVPFSVFGDCSDILVQINGVTVSLPTALWNCASASGFALNTLPLPITDMVVNFTPALTTGPLTITGAWHPRNVSVPTEPGINRREYEQAISTLIAGERETFGSLAALGSVPALAFSLIAPPPIGTGTPNLGSFSTLTATSLTSTSTSTSTLAASGAVSGAGMDTYTAARIAAGLPAGFSTLSTSGAVSGAGFTAFMASPPPIGSTTPSTGNFSDRMRTLQSFGVVGDGVTDDTANLSTALNSGSPLYCQGTMKVTSLITVTAKDVGMFATKASSCVINLTTATSGIYFAEGTTNKITIDNLTIVPKATITSSGAPHTAALDIEYASGGMSNGPVTSVNLKNIYINPDAAGHYTLNGIYLYNTNVTLLDNIYESGDSGTYRGTTNGVVYDTNGTGSVFTAKHLFITDVSNGILVPVHASNGPQGVRIYDFDCVYCNVGVNATGGSDGLSDQLVVQGAEGAVQTAGLSINNFSHVSVSDNYWFLLNSNLASPPTPANPSCYILAWSIAIPLNGASNDMAPGNTCDGIQMTTYTGSRIGVYLIGVSNTNMASVVGTQTLTNLDVGVQISSNTAGWTIAKQATKSVTLEVSNGGTAGVNTLVPPLSVKDGSGRAAGLTGEVISSSVPIGSAVSLVTSTAKTVTSVALTPGDWDCRGNLAFNPGATTTISLMAGGISTVTNALPSLGATGLFFYALPFTTGVGFGTPVGTYQTNITAATTEYLVAESTFGVSTMAAYGTLECRRM